MPVEVIPEDTPDNGLCQSLWGRNECPNQAEFIVYNNGNAGFAVMCRAHLDGFFESYPLTRSKVTVMPYVRTPEEI
jgi:hypothetical protein